MKILFYSPVQLVSGGGCERWHCDITNSLVREFGHQVEILTANLGASNWTNSYLNTQLGTVPYSRLKFITLLGALIPTLSGITKMYSKFIWADTIHVIHGFIGQDILVLLLKFLTGKKVILGWHSPIFHHNFVHNIYMRYFSRYLLNFFDGHMTLNSADKHFLTNTWGIRHVYFIPSGIKIDRFLGVKRRHHSHLNFVTVGQYRYQKGIDIALEAINLFNNHHPDNKCVFRFVGSGEYGPLLNHYCQIHPNITNLGFQEYESLPQIYGKSDIYLLPSREEPFGLVLIETWASGMPVLATKTDGPMDMLVDGKTGWFITRKDPQSLSESLNYVYNLWINSEFPTAAMESECRKSGKKFSIQSTAKNMHQSFFTTL